MNESEHNNLDSFFRKRTQMADIPFDENDWQNLKSRLDEELPIRPTLWIWLRSRWYILALAGLVATVWFVLPESTSLEHAPSTEMPENSQESMIQPNRTAESVIDDASLEDKSQNSKSSSSNGKSASISDSSESVRKNASRNNKTSNSLSATTLHSVNSENTNDKGYVVYENGARNPRLSGIPEPHFLSPLFVPSISTSEPPENLPLTDIEPDQKTKVSRFFVVGIGYGPDFSAVGLDNFVSPGSRVKFDLEYSFSPTFQVGSGVGLVSNKYEAYGDEYNVPARYWRNGPIADEAYGVCKMIDIPINIRYNILRRGKHLAFASAGTSTYFLTKEEYHFEYYGNSPDSPDYWGTDETSVYPFSIINISAGYEYLFKSHGSFQVEPYIKIPLGEVGWGNVELYTIGVYFSYRYRFQP